MKNFIRKNIFLRDNWQKRESLAFLKVLRGNAINARHILDAYE